MENYRIREIYDCIRTCTPFFEHEQEKFNELLNKYLKNEKAHLYIDYDRNCEYLTDEEMRKKYDSSECFDGGMFKSDEEFDTCYNDASLSIYDFVDYKTFCIYSEVKALKYFNKDVNEIIEIINEKY